MVGFTASGSQVSRCRVEGSRVQGFMGPRRVWRGPAVDWASRFNYRLFEAIDQAPVWRRVAETPKVRELMAQSL